MGVFDEVYSMNRWGFGSGHGSLPSVTKGYRKFVESFLRENNIQSVVDYGCGDWQFSRLIDWSGTSYTGVDVVAAVVDANTEKYGSKTTHFKTLTPGKLPPKADLIIVKDVLQHLTHSEVQQFIKQVLPRYKYALITNCILPTDRVNHAIEAGSFRPLDLRLEPFNTPAKAVYSFSGPKTFSWQQKKFFPAWKKLVLLIG